jgi:hypothetical protein
LHPLRSAQVRSCKRTHFHFIFHYVFLFFYFFVPIFLEHVDF